MATILETEANSVSQPAAAPIDFRELVDLAAEPMIVHEGTTIVYGNRAAAALIGADDVAAIVGRPILQFVAPEFRSSVAERARSLTERGGALSGNSRVFIRVDGSRVPVETTGVALGSGRTLVVIRDASRQADAERAQRSAESRLKAFFDLSHDAMGLARDGKHVLVNLAHARLFGFDRPEEVIGLSLLELIAPSARAEVRDRSLRRAAGEPLELSYVTRGRRRDGAEFDLEVRAVGYEEDGAAMTVGVLRDVTQQLAQEARLRDSERRFRELFEFVPVSLWEVDGSGARAAVDRMRAEGVAELRGHLEHHPEIVGEILRSLSIVSVNVFGRELVGAHSLEELLAGADRIHTRDSIPRYRELGIQLAEGRRTARAEGWVGTLTGGRRWIETTATVIPGHEATWGRLLFASVDLSERRQAEAEREALHERLRQAEKLEAVGRLAGGIAHDFNNILSGILGYAELSLLATTAGSELHDHQQRIREASLRARALVRQILAFSRRDHANLRLVDVAAVVQEALGLLRAGIPSSVTLETRIDPDAGATWADPTRLHQVVLNLCSNARDAIGPYGRIEVEVARVTLADATDGIDPGEFVRLRVRDDGVGMDEATQARIFEPYMTTKGPSGGHGLGLPVVHGIVAAAGGAIRVESRPGRGSTFDVYLPRREAQPLALAPQPVAHGVGGNGERVLLVDDDPLVLGAHRRLLESLGYSVEVAADGEAALARLKQDPGAFDLLLTDQTMPRLSGTDLAREVAALRPDLPILLCTGYSDPLDATTAAQTGVRAVLMKPLDRETMGAAIRTAIGRE